MNYYTNWCISYLIANNFFMLINKLTTSDPLNFVHYCEKMML